MAEDIKRLEEKIDRQEKKLNDIYASVEKFRKNGVRGLIISVSMFILPVIGLTIYIQQFFGPILDFVKLGR